MVNWRFKSNKPHRVQANILAPGWYNNFSKNHASRLITKDQVERMLKSGIEVIAPFNAVRQQEASNSSRRWQCTLSELYGDGKFFSEIEYRIWFFCLS